METKPIYVTEPSLPPLEEFIPCLEKIWESRWLTNNGAFHQQFETELAAYLGVKHVSFFTNGMIALQVGMQALRITGEVITTPYTFAATTHAIYWNGCTPVFSDIEPGTFNLDPEKVESRITPRTTALMPVHVYGNPCRHERLRAIAETHGLKLLYDAAHAFGVRKGGVSLANWGDLAMFSFHATKVFNTFEGGALATNDEALKKRIDYLKNFGFADETTIVTPGTNGKADEFRSAFGLVQLRHVDAEIGRRRAVDRLYRERLAGVPGLRLPPEAPDVRSNYGYFPVLVDAAAYGLERDALYARLKREGIFTRRYFYPLTSRFAAYRDLPSADPATLPVAEETAARVLCLPLYAGLEPRDAERIAALVRSPA